MKHSALDQARLWHGHTSFCVHQFAKGRVHAVGAVRYGRLKVDSGVKWRSARIVGVSLIVDEKAPVVGVHDMGIFCPRVLVDPGTTTRVSGRLTSAFYFGVCPAREYLLLADRCSRAAVPAVGEIFI
jgi:hypothetical protein